MSDRWTDLLSDYLDEDLSRGDLQALTGHLAGCEECRETLARLRRVRERAASLVDPPAPDDLWAGIASRLGTAGPTSAAPPRALRSWPVPYLAAAGIALLLVGAGAVWLARARMHAVPPAAIAGAPAGADAQAATFDAGRVEGEIADLQRALDRGRGRLDPKTVAVLEKNLQVIAAATQDAKRALARDPANRDLQNYFADTVQGKVELLRKATRLAGA